MFGLASPVFAQEIKDWNTPGDNCLVNDVPTLKCFEIVVNNLVVMASGLIVFTLFVMFVVGGLQYLTSMGDAQRLKKAQGTLRYAIIGFVLFLASYLILRIIDVLFLGGTGQIFQLNLEQTLP